MPRTKSSAGDLDTPFARAENGVSRSWGRPVMTPARGRLVPLFLALSFTVISILDASPPEESRSSSSPQNAGTAVGKVDSAVNSNRSAAASESTDRQDQNAVVSKPDHRVSVQFGGLSVGAGYSHFSGFAPLPLYSRFWGLGYPYRGYWGLYDPLWWGPFASPWYGAVGPAYHKGQIKLKVEPRTAEVWIEGGYAGSVASLKGTVWLDPGAYDFCLKAAGHQDYCRRIYVLSGKDLAVIAKLPPSAVEVNP